MRFSRIIPVLLLALVTAEWGKALAQSPDYPARIESLLNKLAPSEIKKTRDISTIGPTRETQEEVRAEIKRTAAESAEARSQVVDSLIQVIEGPTEVMWKGFETAHKWQTAVLVLGELKATKAIDILVSRLDQTGEFGSPTLPVSRPVRIALLNIGEPAVTRLIEALSDRKNGIRLEAVLTLERIQQPAVPKLREALRKGDASTRGGAALALGFIGGDESRAAIERAISNETDRSALKDMKYALNVIKRNSDD